MQIFEILNEEQNYKLYVDLDGVLADFISGVKKLIPDCDEEKFEKDSKYKKKIWKAIADYSNSGGRLWAELDMMPDAKMLWEYVSKYPDVEILTASGDPKYDAGEQKIEWVRNNIGNIKTNIVRSSKEKAKYAASNHILIDDRDKSINPWRQSGGIGILHTDAVSTINKLKELGL